jgi:hypothetical protein
MNEKIYLELELDDDQLDAAEQQANLLEIDSIEEWFEILIEGELINVMECEYEPILSEEELREFRNEYWDEEWIDDIDDEIPF